MIICDCFAGDNNEVLKDWQHDYYNDMLKEWLCIVYEQIEEHRKKGNCLKLVKMWDDANLKNGRFDHRCLQECHDVIATSFRFCAKHQIPETARVNTKMYWTKYFKKIASETMQEEYALEAFITVLAQANTEDGYEGEDMLSSAV
jgi:hypothetical protein